MPSNFQAFYVSCSFFISTLLLSSSGSAINYIEYNRLIAKAEEAVVNKQYAYAVSKYDTIFRCYPYNNPIDCYIAAQVASYIDNTTLAKSFLTKGLCFGLPISTVASNFHFSSKLINTLNTDSCERVYQSRINKEARAAALALIDFDQSIVKENLSKKGIYERDGYTLRSEFRATYDSLLNEIIHVTKTFGFPAQKIVGTQKGEDWRFATGPNFTFIYYLLVHHGNAWHKLDKLLHSELTKGNITPQMYGAIADYSNGSVGNEYIRYFSVRPCDTRPCKKMVQKRITEINASRYEIGLCSYQVAEKKFVSTLQYKRLSIKSIQNHEPCFDFQSDLHFLN